MSSKKVSTPAPPTFQTDPNVGWSQDKLKGQYDYLMNGLTTEGGSLAGLLGDSVNTSPEVSRLSQQYAQSQLDPAYRTNRQDLINTLEANGQLTGSTTASSLQNLSNDYLSSLTGMQAQYGLADVSRALDTRVQLYGMGLNTGQSVGSTGLSNQNQMNQFALSNYENQVASALMNAQNQKAGWSGALSGSMSGAQSGMMVGGPYGAIIGGIGGGIMGYNQRGTQGQSQMGILQGLGNSGSKYTSPSTISSGSESIYSPSTSYTAGSGNYYQGLSGAGGQQGNFFGS